MYPKLILLTPEIVENKTVDVLTEGIELVDKLHIKTSYSFDETCQLLEKLTHQCNPSQINKFVLHLNDTSLSIEKSDDHKKNISAVQEKILYYNSNFHIHQFHLSEKFYAEYFSLIDSSFFHQYNFSVSLHHLNLNESHNHFSYIMYGAVYPSISKQNYHPQKSFDELTNDLHYISESTEIPVIAVGGITVDNFEPLLNIGFSGIAIRGAVWNNHQPFHTLQIFFNKWKSFKNQLY